MHPGSRRVMPVCLITGEINSDLLVKVVSASSRFLTVKFCCFLFLNNKYVVGRNFDTVSPVSHQIILPNYGGCQMVIFLILSFLQLLFCGRDDLPFLSFY